MLYEVITFLLRGLAEVERELRALGIPLVLLEGEPGAELARFAKDAHTLVTDFDPLQPKLRWLSVV